MTELEKWTNCRKEIILIKEFLDFAKYEENAELMTLKDTGEGFRPVYRLVNEDELINRFFHIDKNKLKEERRVMLERHKAQEEDSKALEYGVAVYKVPLPQELSKAIGDVLNDFFGTADKKAERNGS